MACSALVDPGLWSETAIERQKIHNERNNVRAAYTHKAEFLEERRMIMTWWSRFLEAIREDHVTPHEFAKETSDNVTRLRRAEKTEYPVHRNLKLAVKLPTAPHEAPPRGSIQTGLHSRPV